MNITLIETNKEISVARNTHVMSRLGWLDTYEQCFSTDTHKIEDTSLGSIYDIHLNHRYGYKRWSYKQDGNWSYVV